MYQLMYMLVDIILLVPIPIIHVIGKMVIELIFPIYKLALVQEMRLIQFILMEMMFIAQEAFGFLEIKMPVTGKMGDLHIVKLDNPSNSSTINSIVVSAGVVFCAGQENGACIWLNDDTKNPLSAPSAAVGSQAKSLYIDINNKLDIYASGYYTDNTVHNHACYWKNFNLIPLSNIADSITNSIFVSGGKVFIAGYYNLGSNSCYWEDGILNNLNNGSVALVVYPFSMFVYNGDIYIPGTSTTEGACYWKNQQQIWQQGTNGSVAYSIYVYNNDVYIAGNNNATTACYWINGNEVDLPQVAGVGNTSYAYSIVVKQGN